MKYKIVTKFVFLLSIFILNNYYVFSQSNVGIGTNTPDNSSLLELSATDKGLLIPRLTTAQRNAVVSPATGLIIYNSTLSQFEYNAGTPAAPNWIGLLTGSSIPLNNGQIFVGNASNVATAVTLSGDATVTNAGVLTISINSIDGTKINLTGNANGDMMYYNGTDWIRLSAGTNNQFLRMSAGLPTWSTFDGLTRDLNSSFIFVGNSSNIATGVALSGDAAITNAGVLTINNDAITTSKILNNTINDNDISNTAEIGINKLAQSTISGDILRTNGANVEWWTPDYLTSGSIAGGDLTGTYPNPTLASNSVDGSNINLTGNIAGDLMYYNGTDWIRLGAGSDNQFLRIVTGNPQWSTFSALMETLNSGNIFVGNASNVATGVSLTGDANVTNTGVFTINNDAITSGKILNNTIDDNDISNTAEIGINKLAQSLTSGDILRTNGTNVEWWTPDYLSASTAAGGDLTGNYPNPNIASNSVDGAKINLTGNSSGDLMYYNGTDWIRLAAGSENQFLRITTGNPQWVTFSALNDNLTDGYIFVGNSSNIATSVNVSGDANLVNTGVLTINNEAVNSAKILNNTIADIDISNSAEISVGKLGESTNSGDILRTNGSNVEWWTPNYIVSGAVAGGDLTGTYPSPTIMTNSVDGSKINLTGNQIGDLMYYDGTDWVVLSAGSAGNVLQSNGAAAPSWGSAGSGSVTSVGLSLPNEIQVSGSPVTTSGTLTGQWVNQNQNLILASPDASNGTPSFRALVGNDIPNLNANKITSGILDVGVGGTGVATLTGMIKGNGTSAFTSITAKTNQVTFWSDNNSISGHDSLTWDAATQKFTIGGDLVVTGNIDPLSILYIPLTTAPASPLKGTTYFDNNSNTLKVYNGSSWDVLGSGSGWSLTGNNSTDPTLNYIGTSDDKDLLLKTNNTERLRIKSTTNGGGISSSGNLNITSGGLTVTAGGANVTGAVSITGDATLQGDLLLTNTSTSKKITFYENNGTDNVSIKAPANVGTSYTLNLPQNQGNSDTYLRNDGSGNLSWVAPGVSFAIKTVTDNYTAQATDNVILASFSSMKTITLMSAVGMGGKIITIKRIGGASVFIQANGSETIDGSNTRQLNSAYMGLMLISNDTNWFVIGVIP